MQLKVRSFVKGVGSYVPGLRQLTNSSTGGTSSARYCYSVWLRHLCSATRELGEMRPRSIAELGPGDSLGIGLAAMLCGADRYCALDRKSFASNADNALILDELAELFQQRVAIPDDAEFPGVYPKLPSYEFPASVLSEDRLKEALAPGRLRSIAQALAQTDSEDERDISIKYFAPWDRAGVIVAGSVDWAFSQAVLEHVDDVDGTYRALNTWLRPGGVLTSSIDYTCHGLTIDWNGHWTINDPLWKLVRGRRAYLINRQPHSVHMRALMQHGFNLRMELKERGTALPKELLAGSCKGLTDADLHTRGAFVVALKTAN